MPQEQVFLPDTTDELGSLCDVVAQVTEAEV
jgi:hypothetical protein